MALYSQNLLSKVILGATPNLPLYHHEHIQWILHDEAASGATPLAYYGGPQIVPVLSKDKRPGRERCCKAQGTEMSPDSRGEILHLALRDEQAGITASRLPGVLLGRSPISEGNFLGGCEDVDML